MGREGYAAGGQEVGTRRPGHGCSSVHARSWAAASPLA